MATSIDPDPISWRQLHQLALDETDPTKLLEHVHAVEGAVLSRWMELSHSANHHEERREMELATQDLLRIKIEKLRWPTIRT
jgi:hypothetical protein